MWRFYTLSPNEYRECMDKTFAGNNLMGLWQANAIVVVLGIGFSFFPIVIEKDLSKAGVYFGTSAVALLLAVTARHKYYQYKENKQINNLHISGLIVLYFINIMFSGLYIGVLAPVRPPVALAFMCYLIAALFLFTTSPLLNLCLTLSAMTVFIICSVSIREPGYWTYEVATVLLAAIIGLFFGWQINRYRISAVLSSIMTETIEHEKERMASRIETIISNLPGMVYQCINNYPEYTILYVSEGSKDFIGYAPEELIGGKNKFMEMVHPDDVEGMGKKSEETINVGLPFEHTYRLIMHDGSIKWIWDRMTVLERDQDGTPISVEGYMFDITRQRELETAELARLEAEAEKAYYDSLTGIYNRRFFDENLEHYIKALSLTGGTLSLMMIDIDFFKKYNDTYGHIDGDNCLNIVAETLSANITRADDFVARYGGEEFAVVLPNTGEHGARFIAEKLLQSIRDHNIPHEKSDAANCVTISIGVVTGKPEYTQNAGGYIKRADEMLYMSKQNGRNRYTFGNY